VAPAETALEQSYALAEEARRELDSLLSRLDTDTASLERKEERLFALRALARKYGVTPDQLPRIRDEFVAKQEALDRGRRPDQTGGRQTRRHARRLSDSGPKTVQIARRRSQEIGDRRGGGTSALKRAMPNSG